MWGTLEMDRLSPEQKPTHITEYINISIYSNLRARKPKGNKKEGTGRGVLRLSRLMDQPWLRLSDKEEIDCGGERRDCAPPSL